MAEGRREREARSRGERLAKMQAQVDAGTLVIRQATEVERAAWPTRVLASTEQSDDGEGNDASR